MPDGLYDADILIWAQTQADLLRRLAAGERVNAAIDWPNLIDEVEDVGRSELSACNNLLRQALIHLLKLEAWPSSQSAAHWRAEVVALSCALPEQCPYTLDQLLAADAIPLWATTAG